MGHSRYRLLTALAVSVLTTAGAAVEAASRTEVVSPVPGNALASGDRLLARLDRITGASATNPWLLKIEPGVYDLGGRSLVTKPWVDVEGSGEGVTTLTSTVEQAGTLIGAEDVEVRSLTVENTAAARAMAVFNRAARFSMTHVTCRASGGSEFASGLVQSLPGGNYQDVTAHAAGDVATGINMRGGRLARVHATGVGARFAWGIFNSVSDGEMEDVTAVAVGQRYAAGIRNEGGAPVLRGVRVSARGDETGEGIVNGNSANARITGGVIEVRAGAYAHGIRNEFGSPQLNSLSIDVDSSSDAFGVASLLGGAPLLTDLAVRVRASARATGVYSDVSQTTVERSTIVSSEKGLANGHGTPAASIRVGASRIEGSVDSGGGTLQCVASYDGAFAPLDAACLPIP